MKEEKEEKLEESKEDLDINPFSYYRESNIFEINGNIKYMLCPEVKEKCTKIYKRKNIY